MSDWMGVAVAGFGWVVSNSWRAALLVGVVLVVQRLLRGRLAAKWQYALWLLVVARLMVPPGIESAWSMFNWMPAVRVEERLGRAAELGESDRPVGADKLEENTGGLAPGMAESVGLVGQVRPVRQVGQAGGAVRARDTAKFQPAALAPGNTLSLEVAARHVPLAWLAGVATLAVLLLWANLRLLRAVRAQRPVLDPAALGLLEACKERMGIRTPVALIGTNLRGGPALFGFVRPRLLVPEAVLARCNARELQHIFLHELAHLKRHDILMNWLVAGLQVLHWFNPVLWFAFHRMRADRELACDALALAHMEEQEARAYGQTILGLLDEQRAARPLAAAVGILEDKAHLKRRIAMIATFTKPKRRWTFVGFALAALLAGAALTDAQQDSPAPASTPESTPAEAQFPPQEAPAVPVATAPTPVGQAGLQVAPPVLPGAAAATVEVWKHTVQEGETVEGIAEKYGLSVEDFRKWNSFDKGTVLKIGQQCDVLIIKAGEEAGVDLKAPPRLAANAPLGTPVAPAPTVTAPGKSQPEVYQNLSINHELEKLLETPVSIEFEDIHLSEIVQFMSESYGINIVVDTRAVLPRQPKSADGKVERFPLQAIFGAGFVTDGIVDYIKLEDVALKSALEALLRPLHLDYALRPGFLFVSSPQLLEAEELEPEIGTQPWQGPQAHLFGAGHRDGALGGGTPSSGMAPATRAFGAAFQQLFGSTTQGPRELLARSQNNLKQCGLLLKMYANEHKGKFPALSPEPGVLMFDAAAICPEYMTDSSVMVNPGAPDAAQRLTVTGREAIGDYHYVYLGYAIKEMDALKAFVSAYIEAQGKLDGQDAGVYGQGQKVMALREGIERFFITDINDPGQAAHHQSLIPIMAERPGVWPDGRLNVLYMDGHVEAVEQGRFPNVPEFWAEIAKMDAVAGDPAASSEQDAAALDKALSAPMSFEFEKLKLSEALARLGSHANINMIMDRVELGPGQAPGLGTQLASEQIVPDIKMERVPLKDALTALLRPLGLRYAVENDHLRIGAGD